MPAILSRCVAVVAASANLTTASVLPFRQNSSDPIPSTALLSAYAVPLSNGTATLPELNNPLQVITVGRGIQNYTCASSTSLDKPLAIGAVATLFNLDALLNYFAPGEGQSLLEQVPSFTLSLPHEALAASIMPQAGLHYFNTDGVPTFDLTKSNNGFILGAKTGDIKAPANSTKGPNGAVDWLSLDAKEGSQKLSRVYRTNTAAGSPPASCEGQAALISVEYAALYYFVSA